MAGPYTAFTYGDPKIVNPTMSVLEALIFGLLFSGSSGVVGNYGWCG